MILKTLFINFNINTKKMQLIVIHEPFCYQSGMSSKILLCSWSYKIFTNL